MLALLLLQRRCIGFCIAEKEERERLYPLRDCGAAVHTTSSEKERGENGLDK